MISLAFLTAAAIATASPALACRCVTVSPGEKVAQSAAIFIGTADRTVNSDEEGSDGGYTVFKAMEMLKGTAADELYVSHPFDLGGNCGVDFEVGKEFLVVATANVADELSTDLCTMSGASEAEIRAVLKAGTKTAP